MFLTFAWRQTSLKARAQTQRCGALYIGRIVKQQIDKRCWGNVGQSNALKRPWRPGKMRDTLYIHAINKFFHDFKSFIQSPMQQNNLNASASGIYTSKYHLNDCFSSIWITQYHLDMFRRLSSINTNLMIPELSDTRRRLESSRWSFTLAGYSTSTLSSCSKLQRIIRKYSRKHGTGNISYATLKFNSILVILAKIASHASL